MLKRFFLPLLALFVLATSSLSAAVKLNIKQVGVNRLPIVLHDPNNPYAKFTYADGPLAYNSTDGTLLIMGHPYGKLAVKVRPVNFNAAGGNPDVTKFNVAQLAGPWHDPTGGMAAKLGTEIGADFSVRGMAYHNNVLYMNLWQFYNVTNRDNPTLVVSSDKIYGAWKTGTINGLKTGRYISAASDGSLWLGNTEAKTEGNWGPALYSWNNPDFSIPHNGTQNISPVMEWIWKKDGDKVFEWQPPAPDATFIYGYGNGFPRPPIEKFVPSNRVYSAVVVDDTEGNKQVVYVMHRAIGNKWYGGPRVTDGTTSLTNMNNTFGRGYIYEGMVTSLIIYPNIIASNGLDRTYYEVSINHLLVRNRGTMTITADHKNRKLYMLEADADWQMLCPVLHQFSY